MATIVFSVSCPSNMRFGYWNIHGVRNKLENKLVMSWIIKHDVIFLGEVKTSIQFTVPGSDMSFFRGSADVPRFLNFYWVPRFSQICKNNLERWLRGSK